MDEKYIIIVAGGSGTRMGAVVPKQFLPLCGRPVLMHAIEAFYEYDKKINIILVLPSEQQGYWKELCEKFNFSIIHTIAEGGETRFHSVRNGLKYVPAGVIVGVHDGVRPLVSHEIIKRSFDAAKEKGAVFPVVPVLDTLRKKNGEKSILVNRDDYCLVQTPQVFLSDILLDAYSQSFSKEFTDDISVVESKVGNQVYMIEGSRDNIKITTPVDLIVAEKIKS